MRSSQLWHIALRHPMQLYDQVADLHACFPGSSKRASSSSTSLSTRPTSRATFKPRSTVAAILNLLPLSLAEQQIILRDANEVDQWLLRDSYPEPASRPEL